MQVGRQTVNNRIIDNIASNNFNVFLTRCVVPGTSTFLGPVS